MLPRPPKVTIWPGGMEMVKRRCSSVPGKGQCTIVFCITQGYGRRSELCRCKLACCEKRTTVDDVRRDCSDTEHSVDEESDSDSDGDDLPGVERYSGMDADLGLLEDGGIGFLDHILEYQSIEPNTFPGQREQLVLSPSEMRGIDEVSI
ncbi:unnamed protein product [Pylaiella littoralis]